MEKENIKYVITCIHKCTNQYYPATSHLCGIYDSLEEAQRKLTRLYEFASSKGRTPYCTYLSAEWVGNDPIKQLKTVSCLSVCTFETVYDITDMFESTITNNNLY
jgi:hypothetical protein